MNNHPFQCELVGGPLDGTCHEVELGFPAPDAMGLPMGDDRSVYYWYRRQEDGTYLYERQTQNDNSN